MDVELLDNQIIAISIHLKNVAKLSALLASMAGFSRDGIHMLYLASQMHDIGKIGVPSKILNKPSTLTNSEYSIVKTHCIIGYKILSQLKSPITKSAAQIALEHHERFNGLGYPQGLFGNQINLYSRIVAIVDVFDALGSNRTYKQAWPISKIINYFKQEEGEEFDPILTRTFLENIDFFAKKLSLAKKG